MSKKMLRSGITTGACAAGAARAAAELLFHNRRLTEATIYNYQGQPITVPIHHLEKKKESVEAVVIKDGGDDPDVTHGLPVVVEARPREEGIILKGGRGVGRVTRPGLAVAVGEAAINPVPRRMIHDAVVTTLPPGRGVELTVSIPGGEEVSKRTLNPRLGVEGGLSILGTTGIVQPMSEEAFRDSLVPLVDMARAAGYRQIVLTPGRLGARMAQEQYGFPETAVVEMSNFVGFMLDTCVEKGITHVLLWGHHGKLIKVAAGIFHTHSRLADARREILASYTAMLGGNRDLVARILEATTIESVTGMLAENNLLVPVYNYLARRASQRAEDFVHNRLQVGTVLLNLEGRILGMDHRAQEIGRVLGCRALELSASDREQGLT
ncbi:cobalamin biosynthesis protein CbiD [Desulfofundulus thermobenzoicus]|uniref:Cobalt-precorrin-5B C(1)-methyltransferase n=1 Tax=Desulfofundulus thermobenzoicus TaxID=29376 RepID=A0A6N7IU78_9FIRM|nr:cobalt-precorrin-5B (C(1))-methyltransferase CbiD [Desulfofundulus thermobenzoicus]MQL53069.1 cobalamin biosynthesis protein CbiD [Desulfofundulus thermobenzoicus]HHW43327.1 cobalamin biosynthesis protein CbiD [Desulfotomaculum sp.]